MFTTGNKFLIGGTTVATIAAILYGVTQGGSRGTIGLVSAAIALGVIAGANVYTRDSNVSAMGDASAHERVPAAQRAPGRSIWPFVFAFGAVTIVVGLVTQQTFVIIGLIAVLAAGAEWMIEAWAARASSDPEYAAEVRNRMANALEFPLAGAIGVGALVYAFSRMMLWTSKTTSVVIFSGMAALVLAAAALITVGGRRLPRSGVAALVGVAAVAVVTGGAAAGLDGERDIHRHETIAGLAAEGENICDSPDEFEVDEKFSQTVSIRANPTATVTLRDDERLVFDVPGPVESGATALQLWRSNPSNIIFVNESSEHRRLTLDMGTMTLEDEAGGEGREVPNMLCTALVDEDGVQLLTVTIGVPSFAVEGGYRMYVPGVEGAEFEVVVP